MVIPHPPFDAELEAALDLMRAQLPDTIRPDIIQAVRDASPTPQATFDAVSAAGVLVTDHLVTSYDGAQATVSVISGVAKSEPGHPIGTKRICIGTDFYETFNRPDVDVVSLRETPIERFTEDGLVCGGTTYELDVIVMATGYDAMTGSLTGLGMAGTVADARAGLGGGAEDLPGSWRTRLPEHAQRSRPRKPLSADERRRVDRAARRVDRRLPGAPAFARDPSVRS